jgi:hypothetical protein
VCERGRVVRKSKPQKRQTTVRTRTNPRHPEKTRTCSLFVKEMALRERRARSLERERGPERLGGLGEVQERGMSKEGI